MAAPTIPPSSQPATPTITPPPQAPFTSDTIDPNFAAISAQQKSLQRLVYELNEDLFRAVVTLPLDVNVSAQQVLELKGFSKLIDANWLVEEHVLTLTSTSDAQSELVMRKCQDVAALYNIPQLPANQSPNQNPTGSSLPGASPSQNQGPELVG